MGIYWKTSSNKLRLQHNLICIKMNSFVTWWQQCYLSHFLFFSIPLNIIQNDKRKMKKKNRVRNATFVNFKACNVSNNWTELSNMQYVVTCLRCNIGIYDSFANENFFFAVWYWMPTACMQINTKIVSFFWYVNRGVLIKIDFEFGMHENERFNQTNEKKTKFQYLNE